MNKLRMLRATTQPLFFHAHLEVITVDLLKGKETMVWTFMGNTRMYQALRDYGGSDLELQFYFLLFCLHFHQSEWK